MEVKYALACFFSAIHGQIESQGLVLLHQDLPDIST